MRILLPKNHLLEILFPEIEDYNHLDEKDLSYIKKVYSFGSHKPEVELKENGIAIIFNKDFLQKSHEDFQGLIRLSENREYDKALEKVKNLLEENPAVSEYHRIMGQILSEQGHPKKAIDSLIEAVRLAPNNSSALIMLGNIYAKDRSDADTALTFYERVLETDPEDHLALNNMGGNLANLSKYDDAKRYFDLAHELNPDYPNTLYGLALLESKRERPEEAFEYARQAFFNLNSQKQPDLYKQNLGLIKKISRKYMRRGDLAELISPYKDELERKGEKEIRVETSSAISTPAKIEIAEVHNRDFHLVKYQPQREAVTHLVMHELGHLDRQLHARVIGENKLFTTNEHCEQKFKEDHRYIAEKLEKKGLPQSNIQSFIGRIFRGLNSQIYNTPIDLFIEQKIFDDFPHLRPYQFVSLLQLEREYIQSATNKEVQELVPKKITRTNKVLSLVNTIQFKKLYGIDFSAEFNPSRKELDEAEELYKEWLAYFNDEEYAVEYELIDLWANDFGLSGYFNLVDEEKQGQSPDDTLNQIEKDPLSLSNDDNIGNESFSNEGAPAGQMAATMYIVDALQYFEDKSIDEIRKVGFEIGMLGRSGIDTDNPDKKYSLNAIPGKTFSGRHLLAYMYTAFKEFEPNIDTGIDFDEEYEQAKELYENEP
jgi:tetratricopeptide (TPR) repeat protein